MRDTYPEAEETELRVDYGGNGTSSKIVAWAAGLAAILVSSGVLAGAAALWSMSIDFREFKNDQKYDRNLLCHIATKLDITATQCEVNDAARRNP